MIGLSLLFVVIAQFLNAVVAILDKHIIKSSKPVVYAFYVSVLSGVAIIMVPFGIVSIPDPIIIYLSLLAGICYLASILLLYNSLQISLPSEVIPVVGAVSAVSTFGFSYWILGVLLPNDFLLAFTLLILGMLFISHFEFTKRSFVFVVLSGVFFGASTVLIKKIFTIDDSFANGFFWSRMANVVVAMLLLLWPANLRAIKKDFSHAPKKGKFTILNNKLLAGLAFICILFAIKLGDVSLVNALSSLQYVFLLILSLMLYKKIPGHFSKMQYKDEVIHKIFSTILIIIGFVVLFTEF
jgi:drug/metabolite transporter (DMT)-like permease